jgi:PAS domain-containing protein
MGPPTTSTPEIAEIEGGRDGQPGIARLFELTSELLATISLDGRFTLLNPAWEQLLGWTRDELQAAPVQHFMHPDDVEQTLALMRSGVPTDTGTGTGHGAGCSGAPAATATPGMRPRRM